MVSNFSAFNLATVNMSRIYRFWCLCDLRLAGLSLQQGIAEQGDDHHKQKVTGVHQV